MIEEDKYRNKCPTIQELNDSYGSKIEKKILRIFTGKTHLKWIRVK